MGALLVRVMLYEVVFVSHFLFYILSARYEPVATAALDKAINDSSRNTMQRGINMTERAGKVTRMAFWVGGGGGGLRSNSQPSTSICFFK